MFEPECPQGYPGSQLVREWTLDQCSLFLAWMIGQTSSVCDGRRYDHELRQYLPTECEHHPHGNVFYTWDVERFLAGYPVID